jgi:hypothetical protein
MSSGDVELVIWELWLDVVRFRVMFDSSFVVRASECFVPLRERKQQRSGIERISRRFKHPYQFF